MAVPKHIDWGGEGIGEGIRSHRSLMRRDVYGSAEKKCMPRRGLPLQARLMGCGMTLKCREWMDDKGHGAGMGAWKAIVATGHPKSRMHYLETQIVHQMP